jgi:protocatechuate 3,4-dioxygenase beta subunit
MKTITRLITIFLVVLTGVAIASAQENMLAAGQPFQLQGQVLDTDGSPIEGAVVEIWQTDINGNYNHPNDASPGQLLLDQFQYFGTSTTDAEGYFAFRTIKPSAYGSRPPHIHVKVKIDGQEVLTTQFYFPEDRTAVEADGVFQNAGDALFVQIQEGQDAEGNTLLIGADNLVLDLNGSSADALTATPAQTEGPYYPVIDFSTYDSNLNSVAIDDTPVTPILDQTAVEFTLMNLNTATGDQFLTIPDMSNRMVREFEEYRPYISIQQFRREIGKYVSADQVAAYEQYVYVPIQVNDSDAETLKQIPGVDDAVADALIAGRPYTSNEAFLEALGAYLDSNGVALAAYYLEV